MCRFRTVFRRQLFSAGAEEAAAVGAPFLRQTQEGVSGTGAVEFRKGAQRWDVMYPAARPSGGILRRPTRSLVAGGMQMPNCRGVPIINITTKTSRSSSRHQSPASRHRHFRVAIRDDAMMHDDGERRELNESAHARGVREKTPSTVIHVHVHVDSNRIPMALREMRCECKDTSLNTTISQHYR